MKKRRRNIERVMKKIETCIADAEFEILVESK
jgi:sugar-specific transcriptional regulator TrmB